MTRMICITVRLLGGLVTEQDLTAEEGGGSHSG